MRVALGVLASVMLAIAAYLFLGALMTPHWSPERTGCVDLDTGLPWTPPPEERDWIMMC
jgi:hypothetical protein